MTACKYSDLEFTSFQEINFKNGQLLRLPIQFSKFNNFLWVCWFLCKNLSNFVYPIWKLHNPYCHNIQSSFLERKCASTRNFTWNVTFFRSVAMNVEGTRSIIELAQKMQNLKALIHVSTAYAHCTQWIKMPNLIRKCKKEFWPSWPLLAFIYLLTFLAFDNLF